MDGEAYTPIGTPQPREIAETASTPVAQRDGHRVPLNLVSLSQYAVNVRSFHPNPQFEPGGFRFEGDDRGFSLGPSYFGRRIPAGGVTSRIWQRYTLDFARDQTQGDLGKNSALDQQCNPSSPGPGSWGVAGSRETYDDPDFKPRGTLTAIPFLGNATSRSPQTQILLARRSYYGGENFAFLGSRLDKKTLGTTVVPSLEVFSDVFVRLERVGGYMDIVSLVYGDGFPNCESFIEDAAGNKMMLGTHVRIGAPSTHLFGTHNRLFWVNALRVKVDDQGHFQDQLGMFCRVAGGPSSLRDKHPILRMDEFHSNRAQPRAVGLSIGVASSYSMWWNYAKPADIARRVASDIGRDVYLDGGRICELRP